MKRWMCILLAMGLCCIPVGSPASGEENCRDATLIYWQELDMWICEDRVTAGPVCTLCFDEIEVGEEDPDGGC